MKLFQLRLLFVLVGFCLGLMAGAALGFAVAFVQLPPENEFAPGDGAGVILFMMIGACIGAVTGFLAGMFIPTFRQRRRRKADALADCRSAWPPPPLP